jgi:hypothetical protein
MPDDLFFRFVALAQAHVRKQELLWRSGVVLFDALDEKIYVVVCVEAERFHIRISGEEGYYLLQTIFYYLGRLLAQDAHGTTITSKLFKRITTEEGASLMVDMAMMGDAEQAKHIMETQIKKEQTMATFNIGQLNVQGNAILGDNGVINQAVIDNITVQLRTIENELHKKNETELANQAKELIEEPKKDKSYLAKLKSFYQQVVSRAKDFATLDKGVDAIQDAVETLGQLL